MVRVSVTNGQTLAELFDVEAVHDSPCSSRTLMVCLSGVFLAEGDQGFRVPGVTFTSFGRREPREVPSHLTGIAFGPESIWLARGVRFQHCVVSITPVAKGGDLRYRNPR